MIAGVVQDNQGAPVEGARVYFTSAPGPTADVAALTGVDGSFALGAALDGTYTIGCQADGFAAGQATGASGDQDLLITLRPF